MRWLLGLGGRGQKHPPLSDAHAESYGGDDQVSAGQ
jgi:hypothetical protein